MKNEIKSVGHLLIGMATQRKWHPYHDFLDFLNTVKENRFST